MSHTRWASGVLAVANVAALYAEDQGPVGRPALLECLSSHLRDKEATLKVLLLAMMISAAAPVRSQVPENPFFEPSSLPYQLPPFDRIKDEHFRPAFEAGMAEQRREVDAVAREAAPPTFENTVVALERSGRMLSRVSMTFDNLNSSNTNDELQKIEAEMAPKLAAHQDAILLDGPLFKKIEVLHEQRASLGLEPESAQLLERYYQNFVRSGARLSEADKEQLKRINVELSSMTTLFSQNLLKATKAAAVVVDDVKRLDGLSAEDIGAAAEAAKQRGLTGKWVINLQNTTIQPVLEQLKDRALRERVFRASVSRGQGGEFDNTAVAASIAALRARQAALLGYGDYVSYAVADQCAKTPEAVAKMLSGLGRASLSKAKSEAAEIQDLIDAQAKAAGREPFKLQPWDWAFYAAQVRKAKYDFDQAQVKPYFELERVLQDGLFHSARQLYGITFKERKDLPMYRPDVRVFEVFDGDGSALGLFIRDDYMRDNKKGGAWMSEFVLPSGLFSEKAVIANNVNLAKPAPGQPVLMTFDEVTTMFHEFGHALHGLFSTARYPLLAATNVPRDFVEFPSQAHENWVRDPAVLAHFARHYQTGEAMPKALFDRVLAAQKYGEGYASTEYLAAAMLDQSWHRLKAAQAPSAAKVMAFEASALRKDGMAYGPVPPRYHTPYFRHSFTVGYAGAYYSYIWAEVLARDAGEWFRRHGGLDRANGDFFRAKILSRGRTAEPDVLFERFYGGKPEIGPLLEYRGLILSKSGS